MNNSEEWILALLKASKSSPKPRWIPARLWPSYAQRCQILRDLFQPQGKAH